MHENNYSSFDKTFFGNVSSKSNLKPQLNLLLGTHHNKLRLKLDDKFSKSL